MRFNQAYKNLFRKKNEEANKVVKENKPLEIPEPIKEEPKGVKTELAEIKETLDRIAPKPKDSKPFKLSWSARSKIKAGAKEGKIATLKLQSNRTAWFDKAEIKDGLINIDGKIKNADVGFVFLLEGKYPLMVVPQWKINPLATMQEEVRLSGDNAYAQQVFIRGLENIDNDPKKGLSGKTWIWIGIGAVILGYVLFAGQGK